jgi:hypothetical protein
MSITTGESSKWLVQSGTGLRADIGRIGQGNIGNVYYTPNELKAVYIEKVFLAFLLTVEVANLTYEHVVKIWRGGMPLTRGGLGQFFFQEDSLTTPYTVLSRDYSDGTTFGDGAKFQSIDDRGDYFQVNLIQTVGLFKPKVPFEMQLTQSSYAYTDVGIKPKPDGTFDLTQQSDVENTLKSIQIAERLGRSVYTREIGVDKVPEIGGFVKFYFDPLLNNGSWTIKAVASEPSVIPSGRGVAQCVSYIGNNNTFTANTKKYLSDSAGGVNIQITKIVE